MTRFLHCFAALVFFFLTSAPAWSQDFTDPVYIKTPRQGTHIVSGDFNGDSKTDLAYWSDTPDFDIYVWYNEGDHNYTKSVIHVDGIENLKTLEVGDLNGDGKDDIVTFETIPAGSKILLFTSTGESFTKTTVVSNESLIESIQLAKFDDDDHLDILTVYVSSDVVVYKGDGAGAFTAATEAGTSGMRSFRYVDLNNDELMDFAGLNNDVLKIYLKNANGYTLSEKTLSPNAVDFEVHDFDGDDFADIAISFIGGVNGEIMVFKNAGDATFPTSQTLAVGQNPFLLAHADYDNDGREDLAASSFNFPSVIIYNNSPVGFSNAGPPFTRGNASQGIIFADMDGDDQQELIELRAQDINIYTHTTGNFFLDYNIILAFFGSNGTIVDLDNDGHNDIVAPSSRAVSVQYGNGDFTFDPPVYIRAIGDAQVSLTIGDYNKDGFKDVVYTGHSETAILLSDNGVLQEPVVITNANMLKMTSADFNNDGNLDIAGQNLILLGDGTGNFTQEYTDMVDLSSIDVGNFNDDSFPDLILTSFDGYLYIALNSGTTPLFPLVDVVPDIANAPQLFATRFNDDDFSDVIAGGNFQNNFSILTSNGDGTFARKVVTLEAGAGVFGTIPAVADFNDDGKMDFAVPYSNIPANGGFGFLVQNDNGDFDLTTKIDLDPKQSPGSLSLGDLNGDEELDLVGFDLNSANAITIVPSLYQPASTPTALVVSEITGTTAKLSLQKGSGKGRIIFIRSTGFENEVPTDNTFYTADPQFASGTGPGPHVFAIAKGEDVTEVTVTALGAGSAYTATAYEYNLNLQGTKIDYLTTITQVQFTTKKNQSINVTAPGDKVMGDAPFEITAVTISGLPPTFEGLTTNISISGTTVTLLAPGPARVKVTQAGNSEFSAAPENETTFCVKPAVPTITVENLSPGKYKLTSSSDTNNEWLLNGTAITDATAKTYEPNADGIYSVTVDFSGCANTSQPTSSLMVGFEEIGQNINLYPNPIKDIVTIETGPFSINSTDVLFTDVTGRQHFFNGRQESGNRMTVNIGTTLIRGLYVIELQTNIGAVRKKVVID